MRTYYYKGRSGATYRNDKHRHIPNNRFHYVDHTVFGDAKPREFRLNFVGDVMLGRLIDQLMPSHVYEPTEARHLTVSKASYLLLHFF